MIEAQPRLRGPLLWRGDFLALDDFYNRGPGLAAAYSAAGASSAPQIGVRCAGGPANSAPRLVSDELIRHTRRPR